MSDEVLYRDLEFKRKGNSNTYAASLSSETIVERYFGGERLIHTKEAIDLSRAKDGLPLLFNHDHAEPIGFVRNIQIKNKRLVGLLVPGNSARSKEIFADLNDGILNGISIGYKINKLERSNDDDDEIYDAIRWMPYEISVVTVPADHSVGVGRSATNNTLILKGKNIMSEDNQTRSEQRRENRGVENERERVSEILAIGKMYGMDDLARKFVSDGSPIDVMREAALERLSNAKPVNATIEDALIGMTQRESKQFSIVRAVNAIINKDWSNAGLELEASRAVAQQLGRKPEGFFVPLDVLTRDLNVGTATAGGNLVPTDYMGGSFIDVLRNKSRVMEMGATVLSGLMGNIAIPRKTSGSTGYWVTEGNAPTESEPAFDQVTMTPNTVGGFTDYTRKILLQSSPEIESLVRGDLMSTIAAEIDRVAINGSGTGAEPSGILNTAGIGLVAIGTNGGPITWDHIVDLEGEVAVDNADEGRLGYLTNSSVRKSLKKATKVSADAGAGFIWEPGNQPGFGMLNGYSSGVSNNVPADLDKGTSTGVCSAAIFGNFADLLIGQWSVIDITVDPYTFSSTGSVRIVALQDIDLAVRHAQSFAAILDATTA